MDTNTTTTGASKGQVPGLVPAHPEAPGRCAWWLCVATLATLAAAPAVAADDTFVAAMRAYDEGRYAFAYGRLVALADAGNADAARVALLMLRFGPQLYGAQWSATPGQIDRWLASASMPQATLVAEGGD